MLAALFLTVFASFAATPPALDSLLQSLPPDSLVLPLRRFESTHEQSSTGGHAAFVLGHLHYARGEYLRAAGAYTRASVGLDPEHPNEAHYWAGVSWLAHGELQQARVALERVADSGDARRPDARFAIARVLELNQRPDRAVEELQRLVDERPGEVGAAALERMVILAAELGKTRQADAARERLHRDYPRSIEAARNPWPQAQAAPRLSVLRAVVVQIGVFSSAERAHTLRDAARDAGFAAAEVTERGSGPNRVHVVRVGVYPNAEEARRAGDRAVRDLGVTYFLTSPS